MASTQSVWRTALWLLLNLQVGEDLQRVQAAYRLLQRQPLVRRHNVTLEQYQWAVATCRSRSFGIPQAREWFVRPAAFGCAVGGCEKQGEPHGPLVLLRSHSCCLQACERGTLWVVR